jgi:predicted amidohydrolase YtcJ
LVFTLSSGPASSQGPADRIFVNAKIFTGEPLNPYATADAVHGGRIVAVGNLPEMGKAVPGNAERIDLQGQSLLPGFIDSHSRSIEGGINRVSADASENVKSMSQLVAFVTQAKKSGKGMNGDFLQILGVPMEFWSLAAGRAALQYNYSLGITAWLDPLPVRMC